MFEGKNNKKAWLYLLPVLILLIVFSFYPIVKTFIISFIKNYNPMDVEAYTKNGIVLTFQNYEKVLENALFKDSITNTLLIAFISVPISLLISLVVSVLLVSTEKLRGFFQTVFFLPYVTNAMAVAMAFTVLFANAGAGTELVPGPINTVLKATGLEEPTMELLDNVYWNRTGKATYYKAAFLNENTGEFDQSILDEQYETTYKYSYSTKEEFKAAREADLDRIFNEERHKFKNQGTIDWVGPNASYDTKIVVVLLYSIWSGLAFKILVFTGGLTGIDKQYYDAAKIDGTSKWRTFWRITVPMISPLLVYLLTTSFIGSFKVYTSIVGLFDEATVSSRTIENGGIPTFVGIVYSYLKGGFQSTRFGAAASVLLFIIIFVITKVLNKITEKKVHY